MTNKTATHPGKSFVTSFLPWLVAAGMLAVYLATLNRRVTPESLQQWMNLSGWNWRPEFFRPLTFLVTYPLRWLPAHALPFAMSFFAATCAALSLALLARSVSLLPYDRTHDQRLRELNDYSLLTIPAAWVPPVFAALVCGLQMTFWENSVAWTSEAFDLLLFAWVIRCLLEFRIDERDSWLICSAVVYGLSMANNWAMISFFPVYLVALIWAKRLQFFNVRFLLRMTGCGLAGLCLIFLFPVKVGLFQLPEVGFKAVFHIILSSEKSALIHVSRSSVILLSLTSLVPVLLMGIRWSAYFGDNSPLGIFIATTMFHLIHGFFFLACVWVALDSPFSPRQIAPELPYLTFYYLGALSLGYFSGYFLLVFGTRVAKFRRRQHPLMRLVNSSVTTLVWLLILAAPAALVCKNLPLLRARADTVHALDKYCSSLENSLPSQGAVVLSDDSFRLNYLLADLNRTGNSPKYLLVDTASMTSGGIHYFDFLNKQYPQFDLSKVTPNTVSNRVSNIETVHLLEKLSVNHDICYIHPSFGYFFERFYPQPRDLVYQLKPYPTNLWIMPLPTPEEITENQAFWKDAIQNDLPPLMQAIQKPENPANPTPWQRFLKAAHLTPRPNPLTSAIAAYYSRGLDYWGTEMEKAGLLKEAGECFHQAAQFNPDNVSARVNSEFNQNLQAGKIPVILPPKGIEDKFGRARSWTQILSQDGPFEDPNFCIELSAVFVKGGLHRQAIQQIDRVQVLVPGDVTGHMLAAQLFAITQKYPSPLAYSMPSAQGYSNAVDAIDRALQIQPTNLGALYFKSTVLLQTGAFAKAIDPLTQILTLQSTNYDAMFKRAIAYIHLENYAAAKMDYEVLAKVYPKVYQINYGLAEIAYKQKDTAAAIKNYELYLTNAPPDTEEAKFVATRLKELKNGAP